jgi:transcriptional regulator with XRE-family HTH domain
MITADRRRAKAFPEIGERLRAYRTGSGVPVEEIARRLSISRAALYRYEAGDVVKLETLERLARLFGVSMTALLGIGIEYFSSGIVFFERLRQLEERAHRMTIVFGPIAYILSSDQFDEALSRALSRAADRHGFDMQDVARFLRVLRERKRTYRERRPSLVNIVSVAEIERFLQAGLAPDTESTAERNRARSAAAVEIRLLIELLKDPPMGVQIGLTKRRLPTTGFQLIHQHERSLVVTSPFRVGDELNLQHGIATISDAGEAIAIHEKLAQTWWLSALHGPAAAQELERLLSRRA